MSNPKVKEAMTKTVSFLTLLSLLASSALAEDVMEGFLPDIVEAPAPMEIPELNRDEAILWRLLGGGEVVGLLVKETPLSVFVDIGPTVIDLPKSAVSERIELRKLRDQQTSGAGLGSGVFDGATGTLFFSAREAGGSILSQQEILENVKRGVVLVSNPGGLGTGWVLDDTGRIVTNQHVVGNEAYQTVTIFVKRGNQWDKKRIDNCRVESYSGLLDIAIVQLDMDKVKEENITLYPLRVAQSGSLEAGDSVFAVGNPGMGRMVLDHTISEGIASSLARNFGDIIYLQTTAAVNPGNSGGPLVNQRGEVVGVVTLKAMFQEGVAFALPVDYIHHFTRNSRAFAVDEVTRNRAFRYHRPQ